MFIDSMTVFNYHFLIKNFWQPTDNMTLFEIVLDFKAQLPSQIQQMCLKNGPSKNKSN